MGAKAGKQDYERMFGNSGSPGCGEPSAGWVRLGETQSAKQEGGFHPLQEESCLVALSQEE